MDNPLSTIAHKLRTPLTVITSTVNNLLDGTFGPLGDDQRKWLKKMEGHTSHLEQLLNEILEIMKADASQAERVKDGLDNPTPALPRTPEAPKVSSSPVVQTPKGDALPVILVVDDEDDIRDVVKEALSMKGYTVLSASNGDEGTQLALQHRPDVILMDVMLGSENGLEVGSSIKKKLSQFVPMILMTGQDDLREKIARARTQPDELLAKPFQMPELYARVDSMLRLKKLNDQLQGLQ